jgi:hypothetical protein
MIVDAELEGMWQTVDVTSFFFWIDRRFSSLCMVLWYINRIMHSQLTSIRAILILLYHLRLGSLSTWRFPVTFNLKYLKNGAELHITLLLSNSKILIHKGKVKLSLCFNWAPCHEGLLGEWRYISTHSLTSALDGGEWSASRPGRFTPRERTPSTPWRGGWVGTRTVLNAVVKRKFPSPCRESNPRTPIVQPLA